MPGADRAVRAVVRVVVAVVVMAVVVCRGRLGQVVLLASSTNVHVGQYMGISLGCGSDRRRWAKSNGLRVGRQSIGWCVVWVWQRRCVSKESEWSDRRCDWLPGRVGTWIDFGVGGLLGSLAGTAGLAGFRARCSDIMDGGPAGFHDALPRKVGSGTVSTLYWRAGGSKAENER